LKFISKSGENKKSPDFATQSGRLFGMSPIMGIRASVIPAHLNDEGICNPFQKAEKTKKVQTLQRKVDFCLK
jgi:hypothetical protein